MAPFKRIDTTVHKARNQESNISERTGAVGELHRPYAKRSGEPGQAARLHNPTLNHHKEQLPS